MRERSRTRIPRRWTPNTLVAGGDWSTNWYNGLISESDITRGLPVRNLSSSAVAGARKLDHLRRAAASLGSLFGGANTTQRPTLALRSQPFCSATVRGSSGPAVV